MKRVYIAGKLNDDAAGYLKNVHKMLVWGEVIRRLGVAVFIPATDLLWGVLVGKWEYEDYFNNNQAFLEVCDYVFVCPGWETSKGTKKEIITAKKLGIPVFFDVVGLSKEVSKL
jgi:hypothetical protein